MDDKNTQSAGASGAIFGLVGAMVGWLVINWKQLDSPARSMIRCMYVCFIIMILILNFMFGLGINSSIDNSKTSTDNYAHLGGLISGLGVSMMVINTWNGKHSSY